MNLDQRLIAQRGFHGAQPRGIHAALIGLHPVFQYDLLRIAFVQAPPFELAMQGAQRQTVIPAKLILSQSTRFKFKHQPLDLLTASSLTPRDFLAFSH
jgi:hypothetical protein